MSIFVSVVLCTYNRASLLKGCIDSLINQTLDETKYEVIIVDNNSTDETADIVFSYKNCKNIHYVCEENPGLSYARNRGVQEASGDYVAFIDDDAKAAPNWLETAMAIVNSVDFQLDCLGGPCHPWYVQEKPDWFLDKYEIRGFGNEAKYLNMKENLSGSNMIWYRQSLLEVGCFDVNLGVVGDQLKLGEETQAFEKLWNIKGDAKVFFSPNMIIYHLVPNHKMKVSYRLKRKFAQGQYRAFTRPFDGVKKIWAVIKSFILVIKTMLRFVLKIFSHSKWQNWVVEDGSIVAFNLGMFLRYLGIEPKNIQDRSF